MKVELVVRTPTFVGSGEEISSDFISLDEKNSKVVVSNIKDEFFDNITSEEIDYLINSENIIKETLNLANKKGLLEKFEFDYYSDENRRLILKLPLMQMFSNGKTLPYIPGTTIKGIITYALKSNNEYKYLLKNKIRIYDTLADNIFVSEFYPKNEKGILGVFIMRRYYPSQPRRSGPLNYVLAFKPGVVLEGEIKLESRAKNDQFRSELTRILNLRSNSDEEIIKGLINKAVFNCRRIIDKYNAKTKLNFNYDFKYILVGCCTGSKFKLGSRRAGRDIFWSFPSYKPTTIPVVNFRGKLEYPGVVEVKF